MSEEWNGITLAEVRSAYFRNIINALHTVKTLRDFGVDLEYNFDTASNGAVITSNNYLSWEFISPNNYPVPSGATVSDLMTNLKTSVTASPVSAWEDFAGFLNDNAMTINSYLTNGDSAVITTANGDTYPGTVRTLYTFNSFADVVDWMHQWFGSAALSAQSSVMFVSANQFAFSLSNSGVTISCTFKF